MQGGLDWELIAMVAAAASGAVIAWDWFASRGGQRSDAGAGLLLSAVITGLIWLGDVKWARKRRTAGEPEPVLVDMARAFFPVIVVVFLIRSFWVEPFKIPSGSMKPTLLVGDFILVNKYTYGIRIPVINRKVIDVNPIKRGDVVVFRYPADPNV